MHKITIMDLPDNVYLRRMIAQGARVMKNKNGELLPIVLEESNENLIFYRLKGVEGEWLASHSIIMPAQST